MGGSTPESSNRSLFASVDQRGGTEGSREANHCDYRTHMDSDQPR